MKYLAKRLFKDTPDMAYFGYPDKLQKVWTI